MAAVADGVAVSADRHFVVLVGIIDESAATTWVARMCGVEFVNGTFERCGYSACDPFDAFDGLRDGSRPTAAAVVRHACALLAARMRWSSRADIARVHDSW